jgi:hypothetical protein
LHDSYLLHTTLIRKLGHQPDLQFSKPYATRSFWAITMYRQSTLPLGYGDFEHFCAAVCLFFHLVSILYIYSYDRIQAKQHSYDIYIYLIPWIDSPSRFTSLIVYSVIENTLWLSWFFPWISMCLCWNFDVSITFIWLSNSITGIAAPDCMISLSSPTFGLLGAAVLL